MLLATSLPLLLLAAVSVVSGALINVTVDDSGRDPHTGFSFSYSPQASWNNGQDCTGCSARPDPAQAYMGTWHDTTFISLQTDIETVTLAFTGEQSSYTSPLFS